MIIAPTIIMTGTRHDETPEIQTEIVDNDFWLTNAISLSDGKRVIGEQVRGKCVLVNEYEVANRNPQALYQKLSEAGYFLLQSRLIN